MKTILIALLLWGMNSLLPAQTTAKQFFKTSKPNIFFDSSIPIMSAYGSEQTDTLKRFVGMLPTEEVPPFSFLDINGKEIRQPDLRGNLVYIGFWATWCTPCKEHIHNMQSTMEATKDRDIVYLFVSEDKDPNKWRNYVKENNLGGFHVNDQQGLVAMYWNIQALPNFFLLDKNGRVLLNSMLATTGFKEKLHLSILQDHPNYKQALTQYNRGNLKLKTKQYFESIQHYDKAIHLLPNYGDAYNKRGTAKKHLKDYLPAMEDLKKAIEIQPFQPSAHKELGDISMELKLYDVAIRDYNRAIELQSFYGEAFNGRGNAKLNLEKWEDALSDFDKAIELDPSLAVAFCNRSAAKIYFKQFESAIADCDTAIQLKPNLGQAYNHRGKAWFELGAYAKAIADYDKGASLIGKEETPYYLYRSEAVLKLKK
jgi:tetratricopeptide (TPR) repeat protein